MTDIKSELQDLELENIAGGEMMPDTVRQNYAVLFGTGVGAVVYCIQAEFRSREVRKSLRMRSTIMERTLYSRCRRPARGFDAGYSPFRSNT